MPFDDSIVPGTTLWRFAGDNRANLAALNNGILQLMYPAVGAGVAEHSDFFDDPYDRYFRSVPEILGVIYDPDAEATAERVRNYHRPIKGADDGFGRPYRALDPETYWWTHATFHNSVENVIDRFSRSHLDVDGREQLYGQTTDWWRRYGMTMRPVPETYPAFREKFDGICAETLQLTPAADAALDIALSRRLDRMPGIPSPLWNLIGFPVNEVAHLTAIGGLPEIVRERFDIPWSKTEAVRLALLEKAVRDSWRLMPPTLRFHPRAREGNRSATQLVAA